LSISQGAGKGQTLKKTVTPSRALSLRQTERNMFIFRFGKNSFHAIRTNTNRMALTSGNRPNAYVGK
jgi:hypothetical protein